MSFEIEIKAHITEEEADRIVDFLKKSEDVEFLGSIDKKDINWALGEDDQPLFRTRYEKSDDGEQILITAKPFKNKVNNIEYNQEEEFRVFSEDWDKLISFCNGLNLRVCRRKYKTGFHCIYHSKKFDIHCEILQLKYLGWFIESEIVVDSIDDSNKSYAEKALFDLYNKLDIDESAIEPRGYNKLLKEVGHEKG